MCSILSNVHVHHHTEYCLLTRRFLPPEHTVTILIMAPDREVFCCVCGVVFDFVRTLNPGELDEDMESQMSIVYDARILSASQLTVS